MSGATQLAEGLLCGTPSGAERKDRSATSRMGWNMAHRTPTPPPADLSEDTAGNTRPDRYTQPDSASVVKPRSKSRWVWRGLILGLLLVVLLVALLPMLLSTGPGTRLLVDRLGPRLGGTLEIDDLSLGWIGGQSAKGVRYRRGDGVLSIDIGEARADELSLFHVLTGGRGLGAIDLDNVLVVYAVAESSDAPASSQPAPGREPDPVAAAPLAEPEPFTLPRDLSVELHIRGLDVRYRAPQMLPVQVSSASSSIRINNGADLGLNIDASVQQGTRIGRLTLKGDVYDLADDAGMLQPGRADYQLTAEANNLPIDGLTRALAEREYTNPAAQFFLGQRGRLAAVLGGERLDARATLKGTVNQIEADVSVQTENLDLRLPLQREGQRVVVASSDAGIEWELTPAGFASLFAQSGLTLDGPVAFASRKFEASLPRQGVGFDLDACGLAFVMAGERATMTDPLGRAIEVQGLRLGVTSESLSSLVVAGLEAMVTAPDEAGEMVAGALQIDLRGKRLFEPDREVRFISEKLPILLIDALGGFEDDLVVWLGATLDLDIMAQGVLLQGDDGSRFVYDFSLLSESSRVDGELPGRIDGPHITGATLPQQPIQIVLRAEAFARLMSMISGDRENPLLRLARDQSMTAYVTVHPTSYAADPSRPRSRESLVLIPELVYTDIEIELSSATVVDPSKDVTYELRKGTFTAKVADRTLDYALDVDLWVPADAGRAGFGAALTLQTTVFDLLDTTGKLPLARSAFAEQVRLSRGIGLEQTPSALFDTLLQQDGDLAALLGPVVEGLDVQLSVAHGKPTGATVRLNWDDRIGAPIDGTWASMRPVELAIDDQGMMTIADGQDVTIELRVQPDLAERWMSRLNPILSRARRGDRPVQIRIDGSSFRFPIGSGSMKGSHVDATVDLGSLEFVPEGLLPELMSWADLPAQRAVFNPARVSLVDGILSYEQLDLNVDNVQLRFAGRVNLESGEIEEMAMRVPGSSLIKVFTELDGVVAEDDFLSIPMSGSLSKPEFDRTLITQEVARLLTENAERRRRQAE